jgi:hypothetical protein
VADPNEEKLSGRGTLRQTIRSEKNDPHRMCFIATAAYGSNTAKELDTLRAYRDRVLLKSQSGRWFVATYYAMSPPLAEFISNYDLLRTAVRIELLDPIVFVLKSTETLWNN